MGWMDLLLGRKPAAAGKSRKPGSAKAAPASSAQFAASQLSQQGAPSAHALRKDLLKLALRETLMYAGIPQQWLSADLLRTTNARKETGVHVRFLLKHWDPRLMLHGLALEQEFTRRVLVLDPEAADWLMGFSWQFALSDASASPPLPHPGSWTAAPPEGGPAMTDRVTRPADIIEGPVVIPQPVEDVKADLERLLALRDDDVRKHAQGGDGFAPTRPATF